MIKRIISGRKRKFVILRGRVNSLRIWLLYSRVFEAKRECIKGYTMKFHFNIKPTCILYSGQQCGNPTEYVGSVG